MNQLTTKQLPSAYESEVAVLGCIFLDPSSILQVADTITVSDFFDIRHQAIYKSMLNLHKSEHSIDPTTVLGNLKKENMLEAAGGMDYVTYICGYSYSTSNLDNYLEEITQAAVKRNAIDVLYQLSQYGYDANSSEAYIEQVESKVFELSKRKKVSSFETAHAVGISVQQMVEQSSKHDSDIVGLDTGFAELNKFTQGFQPGQLIILAARPAMGKSAFAMNLATNIAANNNCNVAIFSLEMSNEQLFSRMVSCAASVNIGYIQNGRMTQTDWVRFQTGVQKVSNLNILFDDSSDSTVANIRAKCRKVKSENGLGCIIIDYLQLLEYDSQSGNLGQLEKVTKITRGLKLMARELEVPVIALSQLSRALEKREDKKPIPADLRDSGSIEQDADTILMLYRDEVYNKATPRKGEADLIIGKNRQGKTGEIPFIFTGEYQRFREKTNESEGE